MSHLSDKDIDRLSREAAEQFDVESSTSGWEALEKKLDKELPTKSSRRRRWFLWWMGSILFLLVGSGLLYLLLINDKKEIHPAITSNKIQNPDNKTQQQSSNSTVKQQSLASEKMEQNGDPSLSLPSSSQNEKGLSRNTVNDPVGGDKSSATPQNETTKKNISSTPDNITAKGNALSTLRNEQPQDNEQGPIPLKEPHKNPSAISAVKNPDHSNNSTSQKPTIQREKVKNLSNADAFNEVNSGEKSWEGKTMQFQAIERPHSFNIPSPLQVDTTLSFLALKPIDKPATQSPVTKIPTGFKPYFEIGALVGSDFSNVRFYGSDKPGFNTGLSIGYQFRQRWQLATGITYTIKKYSAKGNDYKPANDYWTNYVKMDYVSGECSMWEIPLLIRYSFSESQRSKWFLTGGLSSYLMKKETYDLYYTENGIYQSRHRSYPSDKKYFFSIIRLAGGYQRKLTERLSLQLEPYFNMPMKGVGYGRMQINSFGTNLSLIFKIP